MLIAFSQGFVCVCVCVCISAVSIVISPFSFLTLFIWVFFFPLLGESSQKFVNFVYLFNEPALGFIDFFYCFFFWICIVLISSLTFMISFLQLTLGFVYSSFSNSFTWWVKLWIWDFSSFFVEGLYFYEFPSTNCFWVIT